MSIKYGLTLCLFPIFILNAFTEARATNFSILGAASHESAKVSEANEVFPQDISLFGQSFSMAMQYKVLSLGPAALVGGITARHLALNYDQHDISALELQEFLVGGEAGAELGSASRSFRMQLLAGYERGVIHQTIRKHTDAMTKIASWQQVNYSLRLFMAMFADADFGLELSQRKADVALKNAESSALLSGLGISAVLQVFL